MSFGREKSQVSQDVIQKRLSGLLARAASREAALEENDRRRFVKKEESEDEFSDHEPKLNISKTVSPRKADQQIGRKTPSKPNRNSFIQRETQHCWKRKQQSDDKSVMHPDKKQKKSKSIASSSEEDENPFPSSRLKKESEKNHLVDAPEAVELTSDASSSGNESPEKLLEADIDGSRVNVNVQEEGHGEEEPDEIFFKPLGSNATAKKKTEVEAVLPLWVKQAVTVSSKVESSGTLMDDIDVLGKPLVEALRSEGIVGLFPMQKQVIRELLDPRYSLLGLPPRDICVAAPTGSGKTFAYVLPLIKLLDGLFERAIRAVILLPTSELAKQVHDVFMHYAKPFHINAALLTGLKSHTEEVEALLDEGQPIVDVVIATPKSFLKHLRLTPGFNLKLVSHLILDEADRMVDMIIHGLIREVENSIYTDRASSCCCAGSGILGRTRPGPISCCSLDAHRLPLRKLLYSATLMSDPEKLRHVNLFYPRVFHAKTQERSQKDRVFTLPDSLEELKLFCNINTRPLLVWWLSVHKKMERIIVFTRTRDECHKLRMVIEHMGSCRVVDLSANLKKRQRQRVLAEFDQGLHDVLICTSVLSRGLDLKNVEHVVLYHAPSSAEDYVHMVGRTARANRRGKSLILLNQAENAKLSKTLKPIANSKPKEFQWEEDELTKFHSSYEHALAAAKEALDVKSNVQA